MTESINPNIPTSEVSEPISISGGDSPVSFDDLDRISHSKGTPAKSGKAQETKADAKPSKDSAKDDKPESNKLNKEAKSNGKEESSEESSEEAKSEVLNSKVVPGIKFKVGDTEQELPGDALVQVKIDGKMENVSLSDLRNGYSGQASLSKNYAQLKTEKAEFTKERDNLDYAVKTVHDLLAVKKDLRGTIEFLADAMGQDGAKLYEETVGNIKKSIEEFSQLSPQERRERELQEELDYHRGKTAHWKNQETSRKEMQTLEHQATQVMEKYGIDKETFAKRYDELKKAGRYEDSQITPEFIGAYNEKLKQIDFVDNLVSTQYPDLENKDSEIDRISTLCLQMGATNEEIEAVVNQVLGESAEQKLSKKVTKLQKQSSSPRMRDPQKDPLFFGDLG